MKSIIKNNSLLLINVFKISKMRFVVESMNVIINTFELVVLQIYVMKIMFDSIANHDAFFITLKYILTYSFIYTGVTIFNFWYNKSYIPKSNLNITGKIKNIIHKKQMSVDLINYDDPEYYNKKIWACNDADERHIKVLNTFFSFISALVMGISVIIAAIKLEPMLILFAAIYILTSYFLSKKYTKVSYSFDKKSVSYNRRIKYPGSIFFSVAAAKDIRLYDISKKLKKLYHDSIENYFKIINIYGKRKALSYLVLSSMEIIFGRYIPYIFIALKAIITNAYSVGVLSAIATVIISLRDNVRRFIGVITQMQENSLYIENYTSFMNMKSKINENEEGLEPDTTCNGIKLDHVSFKYRNSDTYVLKDINMNIEKGEKVAIVGHNGAGKTTLIKLIMRLYLPEEGTIYMDDVKQENYNLLSLRNRFGVIFQDFQLYAMSIAENVLMNEYDETQRTKVNEALQNSGIYERVYSESNNIKTNVTKEFDKKGVIFSGGQAQKLAISRVFAKDCGIIIMDEPSSALDPISEYEMHKNMLRASENKTVILISHRLSTTKDADKIYYLEHGEIVEQGTHDELMGYNSKYYNMYHLQADKYFKKIS